ncbi:SRPBCC domain-containing protein [Nocardiopsis coralliicola]
MSQNMLHCETDVAAPAERVWELMTEPEGLQQWWAFDGARMDPVEGGRAEFTWKEHGRFRAVVDRAVPGRLLALLFALAPDTDPAPGGATLVEFHVEPADSGTRVRIVETGFEALTGTADDRKRVIAENAEGWNAGLAMLKEAAESS